MRRFCFAVGIAMLASIGLAQQAPTAGPYRVLRTAKVGGEGGFDYVWADAAARRLYIPRSGPTGRITVFNLDTLELVGEIPNVNGHGAVVDPKSNHGFVTSKPFEMFDSKTLAKIKTIDVQGNPDGIFFDAFNERVYDFSHAPPHVTVIDATDGSVVGTIDLGGMPEQAVSDGKGHLYVDLEDKGSIAVVDTKALMVTARYDISSKGGTCASLAFDVKNHILFAGCRNPQTMVILNADNGNIIDSLPLGTWRGAILPGAGLGTDGAEFNPNTMEAFSSQGDGTLTVIKENSPTSFVVEQTVQTAVSAKTSTLDSKTGHILLIAAEYDPLPATPPPGGRGPGRGQMVSDSFAILEVGK